MADFSLREQEHEVERSRTKLTQDLGVLCSSETFAAFTDDLKKEAFETRDAFWEKLKARAASNPAAVMAIGAGLAWRIIQHPPIASALIGVGLFSLWKTSTEDCVRRGRQTVRLRAAKQRSPQGTSGSGVLSGGRHCGKGSEHRGGQRLGSLGRRQGKTARMEGRCRRRGR